MNHLQGIQEDKVKRVQTRQYRVETGQWYSLELLVFENIEMALTEKNWGFLRF